MEAKLKESSLDGLEKLRQQLDDAKMQIASMERAATESPAPKEAPAPKATSEVAEDAGTADAAPDQASPAAGEETAATPAPAKAKGKGKKGPGPPPPKATSEVAEDAGTADAAPDQASPAAGEETAATPAPAKAKGKGKKGPGPPPPKATSEVAEDAGTTDAAPDQASAAAGEESAPKVKGKGKKGPPPPKGAEPAGNPEGSGKGKPAAPAKGKGKAGKSAALPELVSLPVPPQDLVGKKFHWTNVTGNRFAGSMFERIVEDLNAANQPDSELDRATKTLRVKLDMGVLTNFYFKSKDEAEVVEVKDPELGWLLYHTATSPNVFNRPGDQEEDGGAMLERSAKPSDRDLLEWLRHHHVPRLVISRASIFQGSRQERRGGPGREGHQRASDVHNYELLSKCAIRSCS